jgi:site-specific DNA-methyltransferase (adenine-specific)
MDELLNKIIAGDCIEILNEAKKPFADLIFADPPFNIGYKYDNYNDKQKKQYYIKWTRQWMTACSKVLKPTGSFYIAIGDDYAANIKLIAENKLGLFCRNWIIWHYTFGQQTKNKFARSHTHIFYFVKDKKNFTFNDNVLRVISDRQKNYNDKRANPEGKMPDDVWNEYPRLCGTFEERTSWHPCQMPESILARIIRASTREGDWVLDPFNGSGTTTVVAHKLSRKYTGIDISKKYVTKAIKRIKNSSLAVEGEGKLEWTEGLNNELKWFYHENKITTEKLMKNAELLSIFTYKFNKRVKKVFRPEDIANQLEHLRKSAKLGPLGYSRKQDNEEEAPSLWKNGETNK